MERIPIYQEELHTTIKNPNYIRMKPGMTISGILLFLIIVSMAIVTGCRAPKDAQERRNFMIPKKDELPRNKKYTMVEKRKTYKVNKKHKKKR
jgi:hypothetical protein